MPTDKGIFVLCPAQGLAGLHATKRIGQRQVHSDAYTLNLDSRSGVLVYDVKRMKKELDDAVQVASHRIQSEFVQVFKAIYPDNFVPLPLESAPSKIHAYRVTGPHDISKIFRSAGFYIILSDYPVDGNTCLLMAGELRSVYRGECAEVRLRVMSHLTNKAYRSKINDLSEKYLSNPKNEGKQFYKAHWPHCLKLDKGGRSGIDVEETPYSSYRWLVLVHPMDGSSQGVRRLSEKAFDEAFGHPAASRDA